MNPRPLLLLTVCGLSWPLASCSTAPRDTTPPSVRAAVSIGEPRRRLEALAEIEALGVMVNNPEHAATARGIDPALPEALPTGSAEFRRATRPLDEVLGEFRIEPPMSEIEQPTAEQAERAAKAYARARAARLGGEAEVAELLMEEATRLDPGSATLWQELGEARMALGDRFGAADALTMAAELGATDPRVMLTLASDAGSRSDQDGVARWAAAAWTMGAAEPVSPERLVAGSMLGTGLLERGDLLAGAEVLEATLTGLDAAPTRAGEAPEMVRLRAGRAELGFRLGNAWMSLGQPARAAAAFERAGAGLTRAPVVLTQRHIAALAAAGRPATACLEMIEHTDRWLGDLGPEEAGWLRALSGNERTGAALTDAVLALASDTARPVSARRQALRVLVRGLPDPNEGVRLLGSDAALARTPLLAAGALGRVLPEQRARLATEWVGGDPAAARAWGGALARLSGSPLEEARSLIASTDAGRRLLGLGMAAELDRADLAVGVIDAGPARGVDPILGAQLAGMAGRWEVVDAWLAAARSAADADPARRPDLLGALLACQRLDELDALVAAIDADPAASADDLLIGAEYALLSADFDTAIARLDRAGEADGFDERIWERRFALRTGDSPKADEQAAMALGRSISETRPRSALFAMLRAREMAGQGMLREVAELVIATNERDPSRDLGVQLLAQAVQAAAEREEPETAAMVREWLTRRMRQAPGSVPVVLAYAQALLTAGEHETAFEALDDASVRIGHPELARNAEGVLARHLNRADEALARALNRLEGPHGTNGVLERAEVALGGPRWGVALDAFRGSIPPGGRLSDPQLTRWYRIAFGLIRDAGETDAVADLLAALDDAGASGVPMPEELVRGRLLLLARTGDADQIRSFVEQEVLGPESGMIAVQALIGAERASDALTLLADLAITEEGVWEDEFAEWARVAGGVGTADDARAMVERLDSLGDTAQAARVLVDRFAPGPMPGERTPARDRADIAYTTALIATVFDRDETADAMYRLALDYDPAHAWAANDYGYALAERGESLDEAERLLARAYELLPDEASVADSFGWLRYMTGDLLDETDEHGAVVRQGAVTLLERAALLEGGAENATVFEHLGDALWRAGRREEAAKSWAQAESLLRRQAQRMATESQANSRGIDRINEQLRAVRRRLSDAENGNPPPIAPSPGLDVPAPPDGDAADPAVSGG
jgi:tetratricopeptide (TPR) repeat protein